VSNFTINVIKLMALVNLVKFENVLSSPLSFQLKMSFIKFIIRVQCIPSGIA